MRGSYSLDEEIGNGCSGELFPPVTGEPFSPYDFSKFASKLAVAVSVPLSMLKMLNLCFWRFFVSLYAYAYVCVRVHAYVYAYVYVYVHV